MSGGNPKLAFMQEWGSQSSSHRTAGAITLSSGTIPENISKFKISNFQFSIDLPIPYMHFFTSPFSCILTDFCNFLGTTLVL